MKKIFEWLLPVLLTVLYLYARVICYGPMTDSVAAQDTSSYFEAAAMDFPSLEFFEQQRSATLPLFFRLCNPTLEHELTLMAEPYFHAEPTLVTQPGTENIIFWQSALAAFCWAAFALLAASCLRGWFAKALVSALILAFAFVPQIADWDSILLSESLSFSLFALMIGLLFKLIPTGEPSRKRNWFLAIAFLLVCALWIFTRDTNAYFIILAALILIVSALVIWARRAVLHTPALISGFLLIGLFFFQQQSFRKSERWLLPLMNNLTTNIFPYEERVKFFTDYGMPVSEELLEQTGSAEYNAIFEQEEFLKWARRYGLGTYQKFLLSMPLWSVMQIYTNLNSFFDENMQPFFYGTKEQSPHWAELPGDFLHLTSPAVILIDILLLLLSAVNAFESGDASAVRGFTLGLILFIGGCAMVGVGYLGEVRSVWRHVLPGVLSLRLTLWLLIASLFTAKSDDIPDALPPA